MNGGVKKSKQPRATNVRKWQDLLDVVNARMKKGPPTAPKRPPRQTEYLLYSVEVALRKGLLGGH
jgi:hypothetical protein